MTNTGVNQQQQLQLRIFTFTSNISVNLLLQDFRDGKVNVIPGGISSAPKEQEVESRFELPEVKGDMPSSPALAGPA